MQKGPTQGEFYTANNRVYKVLSISSGTDEVILQDYETKKKYSVRFATFNYDYKQVFKIGEVAGWLNRHPRSIYRYEKRGLIKKGKMYPGPGGRMIRFYGLEDVFEMHEMVSEIHQGRPRTDGRIVNNTMPDIGTLKLNLKERFGYGR